MKQFIMLMLIVQIGNSSCQNDQMKVKFHSSEVDRASQVGDAKKFVLKKWVVNADFDYQKLENMDGAHSGGQVKSIFEPLLGKHHYFQFVATYAGKSYQSPPDDEYSTSTFHDILIIKTDERQHIIDAYLYTLKWGEQALRHDLFRSSDQTKQLVDQLDLKDFVFKRVDSNEVLQENGFIVLGTQENRSIEEGP